MNPGTCNDTFGTRAPASGGTSLGSGSGSVAYSSSLGGLSAGTTYYFCAIASSSEGTRFGAVLSFTTLAPPTVTTSSASPVTATGATLNGSANPGGSASYGYFRYSGSNPGTCNDTFGTRVPATSSSDSSLGAGSSPVSYSFAISGLTPATTYYFCAIARNAYGTSFGAVLSFTTPAAVPAVTTTSPTLVTGGAAQLNGTANPGGAATTGWFRYATASPGTCNDTFGTRAPATGGSSLGAGTTATSFSQAVTGLSQGTTYYFCAIASNSVGTSFGSVVSFTTPSAPTASTSLATSVTDTSATLNGSANPNRASTTGWFRYSTSSPGTCNDTFGTRAPASRRHGPRLRQRLRGVLAVDQRPLGGDDLLLLRDRLEPGGHGVRGGAGAHHPRGADGDHLGRDVGDDERGDAERIREPRRRRGDGLLPLRHDEPGDLQRHVRYARSFERRDIPRLRVRQQLVFRHRRAASRPRPRTTSARSP